MSPFSIDYIKEDEATVTVEQKPEVFSLEGLEAWLKRQDPATTYDYTDSRNCLLCRYGRDCGVAVREVTPNLVTLHDLTEIEFGDELDDAAGVNESHGSGQWNFGAALQRVQDLINKRKG